jgi:hypothetical protein
MSVKSLWIITAAGSHDLALAGLLGWVQATGSDDSFHAASGCSVRRLSEGGLYGSHS